MGDCAGDDAGSDADADADASRIITGPSCHSSAGRLNQVCDSGDAPGDKTHLPRWIQARSGARKQAAPSRPVSQLRLS
ncbi:MAG: hypothetical protein QE278_03355 [Limnobacter sp.]|nr:hypothetical protein [Limnobacter sp.]